MSRAPTLGRRRFYPSSGRTPFLFPAQTRTEAVALSGGWNQITPPLELPPGTLRDVLNYECSAVGVGYGRIAGYERYDGRPSPSLGLYTKIEVSSFVNVPSNGQTVTQAVSGATGVIIAVVTSPNPYLILTKTTGAFDTTNSLTTPGPVTVGTAIVPVVSLTALQNAQYVALAADNYRADIGAVPGSGPVRGVVPMTFAGVDYVYALRDNVGGSATILYKATTSGWTIVPFYNEVSFTVGGTATPADGATLTQGAVTATVKRVVASSGAWSGTAAGRFIVTNPAGGNFAAGAATLSGGATVTLSGAQTAITLSPGGKCEFFPFNFAGQATTLRLYGCDGVNRMFEFDGDVFVPITSGFSPDAPKHLVVHKNQLFGAFGSSAGHAGPGTPYRWGAADGGSEIAMSHTVTGFLLQPGVQTSATLTIFTDINTNTLYGTAPSGSSPWNVVPFNLGVGAIHYSVQNLTNSHAMDFAGVINLQTALAYGNFKNATLTFPIQTFISDKRTKVSYSSIYRDKSQYRVFFTDGYALYMTIVNGRLKGSAQIFFPDPVYCVGEGSLANGAEVAFFGANSGGYVFQMERGSSFDGANLDGYVTFNWDSERSPRTLKDYLQAALEIQGSFYVGFTFSYQLGYGRSEYEQPAGVFYESSLSAGQWDKGNWDGGASWDGMTLAPTVVDLTGTAENVAVTVRTTTNYIQPYTLNSLLVDWIPRTHLRG